MIKASLITFHLRRAACQFLPIINFRHSCSLFFVDPLELCVLNTFLFPPVGSQQKPAVSGFWSNHPHRKGLRRPQEVYATDPLRPRRATHSVGAEQSPQWSERHLFFRRPRGRYPERYHVCAHGVWPEWQDHLTDICRWQILELHLPREGTKSWSCVTSGLQLCSLRIFHSICKWIFWARAAVAALH